MTATSAAGAALVERAANPLGTVLLLHSWWGLTAHFRGLAARLAAEGLTTVAVDLYGGPTTDDPQHARDLRRALPDAEALDRAGAVLDTARGQAGAAVGVLGFSMGAEFGIRLATAFPDDVAAVVAFYGVCVPADLSRLTAPVQVHAATDDEFATPEDLGEFATALTAAGTRLELHTYPGTRHAFFNPTRPEAYDAPAAELAWRRTLTFLTTSLTGSGGN